MTRDSSVPTRLISHSISIKKIASSMMMISPMKPTSVRSARCVLSVGISANRAFVDLQGFRQILPVSGNRPKTPRSEILKNRRFRLENALSFSWLIEESWIFDFHKPENLPLPQMGGKWPIYRKSWFQIGHSSQSGGGVFWFHLGGPYCSSSS